MRGSTIQTKLGMALGLVGLMLSTFSGGRGSMLALAVVCLVIGAPLAAYGWWQDRKALLHKQAEERE
jgi:hypothetical protein